MFRLELLPLHTSQVPVSELRHWIMGRILFKEYYNVTVRPFEYQMPCFYPIRHVYKKIKIKKILIMAKHVLWEVIMILIIGHQNLTNSSLRPSEHLYQIWIHFLKVFLRYRIHKNGTYVDVNTYNPKTQCLRLRLFNFVLVQTSLPCTMALVFWPSA